MPRVLTMSALKLRDPMVFAVQMKTYDTPLSHRLMSEHVIQCCFDPCMTLPRFHIHQDIDMLTVYGGNGNEQSDDAASGLYGGVQDGGG